MGEKALWPTVAIVGIVAAVLTVLLLGGIDVVTIIAASSVFSGLVNLMLFGKMQKVEQQTNGTAAEQLRLIRDLTEHAKHSVPLDRLHISEADVKVGE